jgi:hypothetical protein
MLQMPSATPKPSGAVIPGTDSHWQAGSLRTAEEAAYEAASVLSMEPLPLGQDRSRSPPTPPLP